MRNKWLILVVLLTACGDASLPFAPRFAGDSIGPTPVAQSADSLVQQVADQQVDSFHNQLPAIAVANTSRDEVVAFAETLLGTPYVYGSTDPKVGFDCSGFITYVFSHFHVSVPRSSVDFTNVGQTVSVSEAKRGDLILFTGTNPNEMGVGHMGLVVSNDGGGLQFIHATSGKAMAVAISPLSEQYKKRFVRITRIFNDSKG